MKLARALDSWGFAVGVAALAHVVLALLPVRPEAEAPLEFVDIEIVEPVPLPEPEPEPEPEPPPLPAGDLNPDPTTDPTKTSVESNRPVEEATEEPVPMVTGLAIDADSLVEDGLAVRVGNTLEAGFDAPEVDPGSLEGFEGKGLGGGGKGPGVTTMITGLEGYEPPKLARSVRPPYPSALLGDGVEGKVVLRIFVLENGRVGQVELVSATHEEFGLVALKYVGRFRWRPARLNRKPVEAWSQLTIRFEITDEERARLRGP